jgi:transposase
MSQLTFREQQRAEVVGRVLAGALSTTNAARQLGLSVRQVRRLEAAMLAKGSLGLVHGNRGRQPSHRVPDELRKRLVGLATTTYAGLTLEQLQQQLAEREGLVVGRSTVRRILLEAGVIRPGTPRPRRLPVGLMPTRFDLNNRQVELLDLRGADYQENFFHQTVERWRREHPLALRLQLSLQAFAAVARLDPPAAPAGFLFQTGRSGSKLLSDMLSAGSSHLVVKESSAINTLVARWLYASQRSDPGRRAEATMLLRLCIAFMSRGPRRVIFKFSSWNVGLAETLLTLFPTPAAFLYQAAAPAVVEMLARPPGWRTLVGPSRAVQTRFFPALATAPAELALVQFYAYVWRSLVDAALSLPAGRLLALEVSDLHLDTERVMARLLAHFRLPSDGELMVTMGAIARTQPREELRADALDSAQAGDVAAIIGTLPTQLEQRRVAGLTSPTGAPPYNY